jgi:hypothetical protein
MPAEDESASWPGIESRSPAGSRPASGTGGAGPAGNPPGILPARLLPAICKSTMRIYDHDCRLCRHAASGMPAREHDAYRTGAVQECTPVRASVTRREELMILILPAGPDARIIYRSCQLSQARTKIFRRQLTAPRSVRPRAQRAPRQRPRVAARPGSRPAPAAGHLAACHRAPAGRGRRQRAAAAGQVRRYSAGRQFPHQIPDLSARHSPIPGIRATPRRGSRGSPEHFRPALRWRTVCPGHSGRCCCAPDALPWRVVRTRHPPSSSS